MKNLRAMRIQAGLSQEQVARSLSVTQGAVAQWESGLSAPKVDKLPDLAKLYGCTIDELFCDESNTTT